LFFGRRLRGGPPASEVRTLIGVGPGQGIEKSRGAPTGYRRAPGPLVMLAIGPDHTSRWGKWVSREECTSWEETPRSGPTVMLAKEPRPLLGPRLVPDQPLLV